VTFLGEAGVALELGASSLGIGVGDGVVESLALDSAPARRRSLAGRQDGSDLLDDRPHSIRSCP